MGGKRKCTGGRNRRAKTVCGMGVKKLLAEWSTWWTRLRGKKMEELI